MPRGSAYWSRRTELLMLTFLGIAMMADVGLRLWRSWAAPDSLDRLALGSIAFMIVALWVALFRHVRQLDKLAGHVEEKALNRLSTCASAIGTLGLVMLLDALLLMHHQ